MSGHWPATSISAIRRRLKGCAGGRLKGKSCQVPSPPFPGRPRLRRLFSDPNWATALQTHSFGNKRYLALFSAWGSTRGGFGGGREFPRWSPPVRRGGHALPSLVRFHKRRRGPKGQQVRPRSRCNNPPCIRCAKQIRQGGARQLPASSRRESRHSGERRVVPVAPALVVPSGARIIAL